MIAVSSYLKSCLIDKGRVLFSVSPRTNPNKWAKPTKKEIQPKYEEESRDCTKCNPMK